MTSIKTAATSKDDVLTDSELDAVAGGLLPTGEDFIRAAAEILSVPPPPPPRWDGWPIGW